MQTRYRNLVCSALAAAASLGACTPVFLPSPFASTPTQTTSAAPAASLPRDQAPTPTPFDLAACEQRAAQALEMAGANFYAHDDLHDIYKLVTYRVDGEDLSLPEYGFAPQSLQDEQRATGRHEEIWRLAASLIPEKQRGQIRYFMIYTDGAGDSLGAVRQVDSPSTWLLALDIEDARDLDTLEVTTVHELGHLITLNESQVYLNMKLFENPNDQALFRQAQAACSTYLAYEGCTRPRSYLNSFFQRFWTELYPQWQEVNARTEQNAYLHGLQQIFDEHPGDFVSEYAVFQPEEDIAESFMHFVLSPRPPGVTVAEKKVRFFYDYPELVDMRMQVLRSICAAPPGP